MKPTVNCVENQQAGDVLTAKEAAEFLRITPDQVYILASRGDLPGKKLGGSWRFLRSKLIQFMGG